MGHGQHAAVARLIAVAGITADILLHHAEDFVEIHLVDGNALIIDQLCKVGSLAGQAVCHGMRTLGLRNVCQGILVTAGASVILGKSVALVNIGQVGILLKIVRDITVFIVVLPGRYDIRICRSPVRSIDRSVHARGCGRFGLQVRNVRTVERSEIPAVLQVVHKVLTARHPESRHRYDGKRRNCAGQFINRFSFH